MKFYLLSDNIDTQMGMRLAGVDGDVLHTEQQVREKIKLLLQDEEIGIIAMTNKLIKLCPEIIYDIKLNRRFPLIVEIPDRHGYGNVGNSIERYVSEAIGIKI